MRRLVYVGAGVAGLAAGGLGIAGVLGATWTVRVGSVVPLGGLELAMDPLAGLFLALVGFTTAATSLYAVDATGENRSGAGAYFAFVAALAEHNAGDIRTVSGREDANQPATI